jgi:hypothetical protein
MVRKLPITCTHFLVDSNSPACMAHLPHVQHSLLGLCSRIYWHGAWYFPAHFELVVWDFAMKLDGSDIGTGQSHFKRMIGKEKEKGGIEDGAR